MRLFCVLVPCSGLEIFAVSLVFLWLWVEYLNICSEPWLFGVLSTCCGLEIMICSESWLLLFLGCMLLSWVILGCFRLLSARGGLEIFAVSLTGYSCFGLHVKDLVYLQ